MRSTFLKLIFSALILQSLVLFAFERNFGDEVVECVSKIHPPLDSPELPKILAQCEKEVTSKRGPNDHEVTNTKLNSDDQQDNNIRLKLEQAVSKIPAKTVHGTYVGAVGSETDIYAEMQRVARRVGVPISEASYMSQAVKKDASIGSIAFDTIAKTNSATASLLTDLKTAKITHNEIQNISEFEKFMDSIFFWIGENSLTLALAVLGYLFRSTIGAVIATIPASLITGFGIYENRYFKEHGINYSDTVHFAHTLNDPIFLNEAKSYALLECIKFSLLNIIIVFTFFYIISKSSSIVKLCKKSIHAIGNFRFEGKLIYIFDIVVLMTTPFLIVTLLSNYYFIEDNTKTALLAALITAVIAYCSAFTFQGNYTSTPLKLRLSVYQTALFISIIYWLGMVFTEIADREGSGNVLIMLFGLTIVGAVALNRIKKFNQSKLD